MTLAFSFAARSDVGLLRSVNQDSGYAGPHLLVLADGMGGPAGGDVASSIAIGHLATLDEDSHGGDMLALLREAVAGAHEELRERAATDPQLAGLGTTLIAALRSGKRMAMVHIGDSRAYLVRAGRVTRLTTDHTYVQHLVDLGQLTEEEAETHPHRSVILRVLGDHDFGVELDESLRELAAGDRFLLCSDGVSSYVSADTIAQTLLEVADPGACADALVDLALRAGGPDNITAVIADVVELDEIPDGAAPSTTPQVVGAAAAGWQAPSRGGSGAAARAAALLGPEQAEPTTAIAAAAAQQASEQERGSARRRRRRLQWAGSLLLAVLVLAGAGFGGYRWTQTQHYVAASGDYVAVFRGIPQSVGPIQLSHPLETTDILVEDLPAFAQDRLASTITPASGSLSDARALVEMLREESGATPSPTPSATPTPTTSPTPTTGTGPSPSSTTSAPSVPRPPAPSLTPTPTLPTGPDPVQPEPTGSTR